MNMENNDNPERDKIVKLLSLNSEDHDTISSHYQRQRDTYQDQMRRAANITDRIKLQNMMIALDDAFLDYQSSLHK